jgi:hypothetical protein
MFLANKLFLLMCDCMNSSQWWFLSSKLTKVYTSYIPCAQICWCLLFEFKWLLKHNANDGDLTLWLVCQIFKKISMSPFIVNILCGYCNLKVINKRRGNLLLLPFKRKWRSIIWLFATFAVYFFNFLSGYFNMQIF